jgi:hypothetical protein
MTDKLLFANGNAKLKRDTAILSLPAGYTCPFAKECKSCANRLTGRITDGPHTRFRCYATSAECLFRNIREARWRNFELLKTATTTLGMASLLESSLLVKRNIKLVRFHQSGDFFNQAYFDSWLLVAREHPEWLFYGYTKALPYWAKRLNTIPANFKLVASRGGTHDHLIEILGLRSARVVFSEREARRKWHLEIDHDDTHCWKGDKDFAILLHGTQPAGSPAGKAWHKIKTTGPGGYKSDYFKHYDKAKGKKIWKPAPKVVPVIRVRGKVISPQRIATIKPFQLLPARWAKKHS